MIDSLKNKLKDIRKNLEKSLICSITASQCKATSDIRKQVIEQMEKTSIQGLKSNSKGYLESFTATAKGQWVEQAQTAFKNTSTRLDEL